MQPQLPCKLSRELLSRLLLEQLARLLYGLRSDEQSPLFHRLLHRLLTRMLEPLRSE